MRVFQTDLIPGNDSRSLIKNARLHVPAYGALSHALEHRDQSLRFDGSRFLLRADARPAETHFRRWYQQAGSDWLRGRVNALANRAGSRPARVELRDLGYRWGSCGRNRVPLFKWRLLQLPARRWMYCPCHRTACCGFARSPGNGRTRNSTRIEGNTLSSVEVGQAVIAVGKSQAEMQQQVWNYWRALEWIEGQLEAHPAVSEEFICELHCIVLVRGARRVGPRRTI